MKLNVFLILLFLLCYCGACEKFAERAYGIKFINSSSDTISIFYSLAYPDTTLKDQFLDQISILYPGHERYHDSKQEWAEVIREQAPGKKLQIFVFPGAVNAAIHPERWLDIKQNYRVLKRYELSAEDLIKLNHTVVYP